MLKAAASTLLTTMEMRNTLNQFGRELQAQAMKRRQEAAEKNQKVGEAFLAENKGKAGVVTLPDGLQYKIISNGAGASPAANDIVTVSYEGRLIDGTTIRQFGQDPVSGGRCHSRLDGSAYPDEGRLQMGIVCPLRTRVRGRGRPPRIEPGSTLIFTLELLAIQHPQPVTSDIIKVPSADEMKRGATVEIIKPEDAQKAQQQ